jgi:hypothetical protein
VAIMKRQLRVNRYDDPKPPGADHPEHCSFD